MRAVLALIALLGVTAPALAQSDAPPAAVDRRGIEGAPIPLDSKDPDFAEYLANLTRLIKSKWAYPCVKDPDGRNCEYKSAELVAEFGILRDGELAFVDVRKPSGEPIYDQYAVDSVKRAAPFPPVPAALMQRVSGTSTGIAMVARFVYQVDTGPTPLVPSPRTEKGAPATTAPPGTESAPATSSATPREKAGVITALVGDVTSSRVGVVVPLKVNDDVFMVDLITTGTAARVRMLIGGKAVIALGEQSAMRITEVPGRGVLDLSAGRLDVAVAEARMSRGEAIEIRTPNAVATVRGTRVIVETGPAAHVGSDAPPVVTQVDVLAGSITVSASTSTPVPVGANQGVTITGDTVGPIRARRALSLPAD